LRSGFPFLCIHLFIYLDSGLTEPGNPLGLVKEEMHKNENPMVMG
jgi:hypothetical protein